MSDVGSSPALASFETIQVLLARVPDVYFLFVCLFFVFFLFFFFVFFVFFFFLFFVFIPRHLKKCGVLCYTLKKKFFKLCIGVHIRKEWFGIEDG